MSTRWSKRNALGSKQWLFPKSTGLQLPVQLLLPIFAAAIVGGVGNPLGAIAGGFVIAFSELIITFAYKKVIGYVTPDSYTPDGLVQMLATDYKFAVSFLILVIVLLVKPTGIFSGKSI